MSGTTCNLRSPQALRIVLLAGLGLVLAGCSGGTIGNLEPVASGGSYQAEYQDQNLAGGSIIPVSASMNADRCSAPAGVSRTEILRDSELLSAGDIVEVTIGGDDTFSGRYEISVDGTLRVRQLPPVPALGRPVSEIEAALARALTAAKFYNAPPVVSVRLADSGAARVFVEGAIFEPGMITIGGASGSDIDPGRQQALGATASGRRLSRALQSAGGIRPDADLSRVTIVRNNSKIAVDLRPTVQGGRFSDPVLLDGDQVSVRSRGCFQADLMVPSAISPVGAKVFMSNLTEPANSNANSAIGKETRELRYGTRFLQALVGMNCVGGSRMTNANRVAVLYTRNPVSGQSIVIQRDIEKLIHNANRDDVDPFILPNDAIACYDSGTTDMFKIAQGLGIVAGTVVAARGF